MKIIQPKAFTFEAGPRAVLLLHGFTGHSADVRMLGRYLQTKNYTSHAPIYEGHGVTPEELLNSNPEAWWNDVMDAFAHLKQLGYEEIAVAGLSLGGVFGLKLAYSEKIKAVIPMCTPMFFDNEKQLTAGFKGFAKEYKQLERKDDQTIKREIDELFEKAPTMFEQVGELIASVKDQVDTIYTPTMVIQGRKDLMINTDSANYIYDNVEAIEKQINWYEQSGHVITLGKEKDALHEDIYTFLESLDWEE